MKKIIVFVFGLLLASGVGFAQTADVKGPKAKNTKPWKHNREKTTIILAGGKDDRTVGPKAKNERNIEAESQIVLTETNDLEPSGKSKKMGPNAKNQKPGKN